MEAGSRYKKVWESPERPEYMKFIGIWGFPSEEKWHFIQVFEVEKSKVADALERNDTFLLKKYGDIPGFAFTNRVAYDSEEVFKMLGID
jgi:hypothetical protein